MLSHVTSVQQAFPKHKIIHLVREPKGIIYSRLKSRKERLDKKTHPNPRVARMTNLMIIFDSLDWGFRNFQIERLKSKKPKEEILFINYKNLNKDFEGKIIPFLEGGNMKIEFEEQLKEEQNLVSWYVEYVAVGGILDYKGFLNKYMNIEKLNYDPYVNKLIE